MTVKLGEPIAGPLRSLSATPFALVVSTLGVLALLAPFVDAEQPLRRVGVLLAIGGGLQVLHGVRRVDVTALRRAVTAGVVSTVMGLLVLATPQTSAASLALLLAIAFAVEGLGYALVARRVTGRQRALVWLAAGADAATAVALVLLRHTADSSVIAIVSALRLFGIAWAMAVTPVHTAGDAGDTVIDDLGLDDRPEAVDLLAQVTRDERVRASSDRRWTVAFLITLFMIHSARLETDGTLLGYATPAIALAGDMVLALLFGFLIATPVAFSLRGSTRGIERMVWRWYLSSGATGARIRRRAAGAWLRYRLRSAVQLREARFSLPAALWRGLATGIPIAAIVAATVPVWGMSWFFDTENWASGIWNSWAEARADTWREAMVRAVPPTSSATPFAVTAPGTDTGDFSFIVIGDTGEGDASQHALRDQLLTVASHPDVRFVAIGSDVVYPNGSMIDYEANFWLPFKGVSKPVFAIPGNHDWYDALEAFLATFLQPDAARAAMRARAEADLRLTSTTATRIDTLIAEADRLRREYAVPTGFQRAPFFEFQSDGFALVALDTGIVKRIDPAQWAWLESALDRARGKLTMALLGHPLYAKAFDMAYGNAEFARLKRLLLDRGVTIVMAGDTHDFEYYAEPPRDGRPAVHHFVNGGGGAYLSMGTALDWPESPPTAEWAFYPSRESLVRKIDSRTPWWKRPAWWWTKTYHAWPFSSEYLSALFDYNVAPFFQSFVEVRVERSAKRVRLLPYGVAGRLRWRDLSRSPVLSAMTGGPDDVVEWVVPMR
jgi:uncharacterized membrane protein HdeD (DUF308 family)